MNMKTILMAMLLTSSILATPQIPEKIIFNDQEKELLSYPLDAYLERFEQRPEVTSNWHTGLYRGYVGTWLLKENHLWLKSYETLDDDGINLEQRPFTKLNKWWWRGPVKAEWFSGELDIPDGDVLYTSLGRPTYERYIKIMIREGKVISQRVEKNERKPWMNGGERDETDPEWIAWEKEFFRENQEQAKTK